MKNAENVVIVNKKAENVSAYKNIVLHAQTFVNKELEKSQKFCNKQKNTACKGKECWI